TVGCSAVPHVRVHDDDGPGLPGHQLFTGDGTCHAGVGQAAPGVRPRNHARGAVLRGEVVEQPDRVAYPVAGVIGDRAGIDMQRLRFAVVRIGRACVETAQLVAGSDDVLDALEDLRHRDQLGEDGPLV